MNQIVCLPVGRGQLSILHRPSRIQVAVLANLGCDCVVTILSAKEGAERIGRQVQNHAMEWLWLPVPNGQYPRGEMHDILLSGVRQAAERLDQGKWLHVHCSAGIHRTGMFTYGLLRWIGYSQEAALELIGRLRPHTRAGMMQRHIEWGEAIT